MCPRVHSRAIERANVVFPLPAQPTTTTRSGIGQVKNGRAVMPMTVRRKGQAPKNTASNLACSHENAREQDGRR